MPEAARPAAEARAKRLLLLACAVVAAGLAVAGTVDSTTGGVILLAGWLSGVAALHRLGRAGSQRDQSDASEVEAGVGRRPS